MTEETEELRNPSIMCIWMGEDARAKINEIAMLSNKSRSRIVREAVEEYLIRRGYEPSPGMLKRSFRQYPTSIKRRSSS